MSGRSSPKEAAKSIARLVPNPRRRAKSGGWRGGERCGHPPLWMTGDARKRGEHAESGIEEGLTKRIARLCTIMHDWTRFPASLPPSPGITRTGRRTGGPGCTGSLRPGHFLSLFAISSQKTFFFTFIDLYPPLSTFIGMVWRPLPAPRWRIERGRQ
jgi:hypothetical protein